jgi:Holliday junction DNA helicase RuvA
MKLPGIGKKTAQRMILDLKDKLGAVDSRWAIASLDEHDLPVSEEGGSGSTWSAAREALVGLGYRDAELDKAWHALKDKITGEESADVLIKKALQQLFQG